MNGAHLLVEAESFRHLGGWVVDQQFMDQMGSPFLLAHGLGKPVADAVTQVRLPATGTYRVWVRTRDWVGEWKQPNTPPAQRAEGSPGAFQLLVNNQPLATTFGTEGAQWHWQDGGTIEIKQPEVMLALHDLTGFEGRCDAILFTQDTGGMPNDAARVPAKVEDGGEFDFVVVGGGIAGVCAAVAAAREGLRVALVQDRPVLGGNNSSEVRVWLGGETRFEPYPKIGNLVAELEPAKCGHYGPGNTADLYEDDKRIALCRAEKNLTLYLGWHVNEVAVTGGTIRSVTAQEITTARRVKLAGRWFCDCTGDGDVGFRAGADFEITGKQHMGPTNIWNFRDAGQPTIFPRCPWALRLDDKPFPGRGEHAGQFAKPGMSSLGGWFWESGFDKNPITDVEQIRDLNFRAMYGAWDALKNVDKLYPNHRIGWAAFIAGKRESRRLLGDVILDAADFTTNHIWPDGVFPCTWSIDLHHPNPTYQNGLKGEEFISKATVSEKGYSYKGPYWAPYRCLYSRNITNLFMAGRDISVTHDGLGPVRVMRTCGMMGEIVGKAAWICVRHETSPRGVFENYLPQLNELMSQPGTARRAALNSPLELPAKRID